MGKLTPSLINIKNLLFMSMDTEKKCIVCKYTKPLNAFRKRTNKPYWSKSCIECLDSGLANAAITKYEGEKELADQLLARIGYDVSNKEKKPVYKQFFLKMKALYGVDLS